ncbi:MAG: response regulator transcription factor [Pseudolabrys sp.]
MGGALDNKVPQSTDDGAIFVVDDDPDIRALLREVFTRAGYAVTCFGDGETLLKTVRSEVPLCILLDVHIPGRSGLNILKQLDLDGCAAPVFMISGQGDIEMAVTAMKDGALDFIEKPFRPAEVVKSIRAALEARKNPPKPILQLHLPGRQSLTRREGEVLLQITAGLSNKEAARSLGISPRTVELHRARIMQKLNAKNTADLVRIACSAGG